MKKMLMCDTHALFDFLTRTKECVDTCEENVSNLFWEFEGDDYEFECEAYENIMDFYAVKDIIPYFYDELPHDDDDDSNGDELICSSDEMVEYYDLLKTLKSDGVISSKLYESKISEMKGYIMQYICYTQGYGYDGVYVNINDKEVSGEKYSISVLLIFDCCFSHFDLYRGLIMLFDTYKTKLRALKERYCVKQLAEAA